jgi:hypothetical protein
MVAMLRRSDGIRNLAGFIQFGAFMKLTRLAAILVIVPLALATACGSQGDDNVTTGASITTPDVADLPTDPNAICVIETLAAAGAIAAGDSGLVGLAKAIGQDHPMFSWSLTLSSAFNNISFNQGAAAARDAVHSQAAALCAGARNPMLDSPSILALLPLVPPEDAEALRAQAEAQGASAAPREINDSDPKDVCRFELIAVADLFEAGRSSDAFNALGIENTHLRAGQDLWTTTVSTHIKSGQGAASEAMWDAASTACAKMGQKVLSPADLASLIEVSGPENASTLTEISLSQIYLAQTQSEAPSSDTPMPPPTTSETLVPPPTSIGSFPADLTYSGPRNPTTSFRTENGNIWCAELLTGSGVACKINDHAFPIPRCTEDQPGFNVVFYLDDSGQAGLSGCDFDSLLNQPALILKKGSTADIGGDQCTTDDIAVRCTNDQGNGFQFAASGYNLF